MLSLTPVLPIRRILVAAMWLVWTKRARLFLALVLPVLLILLLEAVIPQFYPEEPGLVGKIIIWAVYLARVIPYALFILTCHRIFLLGDNSVPHYGIWRWSYRELQFFGWLLMLYIIYYLTLVPVFLLAWVLPRLAGVDEIYFGLGPVMFMLVIMAAYVLARLSVLVPAAALEHRPTIKSSWALTRGYGIQMFILVIILPWVFALIVNLLPWIEAYRVMMDVMFTLIWIVLLSLEVAMLSLAYRQLSKEPGNIG